MTTETTARPISLFDMKAQQALIRAEMNTRIAKVLDSGAFVNGPEVREVEEKLAAFAGARHAVGVSSGTDALQIAMMAEKIGPGDAVFLPAFTYTATAEVPLVLGATPVFVDVAEDGFNIDIADLKRRITLVKEQGKLRPRAVVGVDLYGLPADWPAILEICRAEGMFALDDAAQAFGGALDGKRLGAWADATALSFYPTKTLGCYGDGGAILTNDADRAELYRSLRTHGEGKTRYEVERTGMNGRLDTIQAAILLCKLPLLEQELASRTRIAGWYAERLANHVVVPRERPGAQSAWGLYTVILPDAATRDRVMAAMKQRGVPSAIYYPKPLHHQPAYAAAHAAGLPNGPVLSTSESLCERVLSLPMHPYLDEGQVAAVADALIAGL
ncbi:aminotransferase class I/II-fold pyridoxal phosphate-dependent enzyme [Pseudoroseomonas wenyumeiae]|uniref:Aminotransferase class I/II-fold pyridoxal phosphate-dependent enzyme n=1 Tax=Teichococcus wenyumeiae TaxID=2478470 RepID=A0A3A9JKF9_9PROT|nr:DegT/DnrJ/EryC1/StrS family aminotransferase [Pseudoroseomonas wenyumeiae]RKK04194.1 DegT/DnrJ/EryC1/StrS family aminotransferase [Pseudoroseomonas wenyumeiae]RMI27244.1 aminotransferase class I/II-fold pyridoxal phosphate-dependent enzyme [Pseudoroseomonas wenyumeiae]